MKKVLLFIYLLCVSITINAQDLISKIPKDANIVVTLKGENITDLVSISEFENSRIGRLFLKELKNETDDKISNLKDLGIDLDNNFYYFMTSDSTAFSHNFLVPLKNKEGFESLMPNRQKKRTVREGDLSYTVNPYDDSVLMWNNKMLLITVLSNNRNYDRYSSYNSYNNDRYIEETVVEAAVEATEAADAVESADYPVMTFYETEHDFGDIIEGDVLEHVFKFKNTGSANLVITNAKASCGCTVPSYPKNTITTGATGEITVKFDSSDKSGQQSKTITITANTEDGTERLKIKTRIHSKGTKLNRKIDIVEDVEVEEVEETIIESTESDEVEIEETIMESSEVVTDTARDSQSDYEKRKKERKALELERETLALKRTQKVIDLAKKTLKGNYADGTILKNSSFAKAYGSGKDEALAWIGDFAPIYNDGLGLSSELAYELGFGRSSGIFNNIAKLYNGTSLTSKLNFEETKATLKTSYTMNSEMANYAKAMYNGTVNPNFFKYFNEDRMLGYFSINTSTKGALQAYPDLINSLFENSGDREIATFSPIGTRLFSLLLDEEGAAKILRGDMLFVLTELKDREVTYKTYDYDDNYNRKQITKTKTETLPGFLMMVTSSEKDLFTKLMNIAVDESRGKITASGNGVYVIRDNDFPFDINVMFKDNVVIIGSSTEDMMAISKGNYKSKVSSNHKKLITKNSSVIYVNGKEIATKFPRDIMPRDLKERIDFIAANTEDVVFRTSKVKGNTINGEMILNTPKEGNKNSLAYFLNMINALVD